MESYINWVLMHWKAITGFITTVVAITTWLLNRPRVKAKIIRGQYNVKQGNIEVIIELDCTNLGNKTIGIETEARISGIYFHHLGDKRQFKKYEIAISNEDRSLKPHINKKIILKGILAPSFPYTIFRVITLRLTRGFPTRIYLHDGFKQSTWLSNRWFSFIGYIFNKLPAPWKTIQDTQKDKEGI